MKLIFILFMTGILGCGQKKEPLPTAEPDKTESSSISENISEKQKDISPKPATSEVSVKDSMSLFIAQSWFKANDQGRFTVPDKGQLLILKAKDGKWESEQIEDTESNVFHKALPLDDKRILTIGGNAARLKLWSKKDGNWTAETIWGPEFGGKHNRLRDFEKADFDGDGKDDLAIVTHDQGVVAVLFQKDGGKWEVKELNRESGIFVHEAEIGDLDYDGKLEIITTPSLPNTVSGKDQGGKVMRYAWNGKGFDKSEIVSFDTRHIKEIMVKDLDRDGKDELYAAIEAETDGPKILSPVEIRRYDYAEGKFSSVSVVTLEDRFCRFLTSGDMNNDGTIDLIAAAFSSGVTLIKKEGSSYIKTTIDADSGGFEHAAYVVDLDKDGKPELYVADDKTGTINRYIEKDGVFVKQELNKRQNPTQAMVWNITHADF